MAEGKNGWVEVRQEMVSTNEWLKQEALAKKLPHGSLAAAQYQSGGKGRRGRSFYSPKDSGLYLSVLLHPKKTAQESLEITAAAAVAVCKAVEQVCGVSLGIKWVNDLYLEEKKVCGILTEAVTDFETGDIEFVVVGIGLNLYPPEGGFPKYLEHVAGTILEPGQGADRNRLAGEIVNRLFGGSGKTGNSPEYIKRNIVPGKQVKISYGSQERVVIAKKSAETDNWKFSMKKGREKSFPAGMYLYFFLDEPVNPWQKICTRIIPNKAPALSMATSFWTVLFRLQRTDGIHRCRQKPHRIIRQTGKARSPGARRHIGGRRCIRPK